MAIRQYNLSSLCLDIEILFEDLSMLNSNVLTNKQIIQIVPNILIINTIEKCITIVGHKINNSTYMVNREGRGDTFRLSYKHSDEYILNAIQKLYKAYTDYVLSNSFNEY